MAISSISNSCIIASFTLVSAKSFASANDTSYFRLKSQNFSGKRARSVLYDPSQPASDRIVKPIRTCDPIIRAESIISS